MAPNPPYVNAYGTLGKVLDKIKTAAVPERFTQDFLSTKLGFKGGSPKPIIPFMKKIGLLGADGTPTDIYKQFRNPTQSGIAIAKALKEGYKDLYEMNEYLHDATASELSGIVVQATGLEKGSKTVKAIVNTFKTLKERADFKGPIAEEEEPVEKMEEVEEDLRAITKTPLTGVGMNLSYTINLNLPATKDIAVFDAIFKSLRENLLKK